jgi:hypothetical protein
MLIAHDEELLPGYTTIAPPSQHKREENTFASTNTAAFTGAWLSNSGTSDEWRV